jgi:acetyl-CoA carboxylase beta subunit
MPDFCPLNKEGEFPCPPCVHCEKTSFRGEYAINVKVLYRCKFPYEVNISEKMRIIRSGETDSRKPHLLNTSWRCPKCLEIDSVRYDIRQELFVCTNPDCISRWTRDEGIMTEKFDGFEKPSEIANTDPNPE